MSPRTLWHHPLPPPPPHYLRPLTLYKMSPAHLGVHLQLQLLCLTPLLRQHAGLHCLLHTDISPHPACSVRCDAELTQAAFTMMEDAMVKAINLQWDQSGCEV